MPDEMPSQRLQGAPGTRDVLWEAEHDAQTQDPEAGCVP